MVSKPHKVFRGRVKRKYCEGEKFENMGMYTTLEFKGIVKEKYRNAIDIVVNFDNFESDLIIGSVYDQSEKWKATGVDFMEKFSHVPRANFIPNGRCCWNKETGEWQFVTELKNYENTYGKFFGIVPLFMESLEICKTQYEEDEWCYLYELENGSIIGKGTEDRCILDEEVDSLSQEEREQIAERIVKEDGRIDKFEMARYISFSISLTISIIALILSLLSI